MRPESRKKGFAMLEVMIIIMIFMVLAASLFASAGAMNRRAVKRATNNEAYYAALAALKLMAGEVMNDEQGQAAVALTGGSFKQDTNISITADDGETRSVPVSISSDLKQGGKYLVLSAKATVNDQTENVSMTLQKRAAYVPDYPYGCGIMGKLSLKSGSEIITGPDVDLYIQGYAGMDAAQGRISEVGGNLVADNAEINLDQAKIGGMIISNDNVILNNCVVGNSKEEDCARKGGIYTTGLLSLTNCDVYGNIYSGKFAAGGEEDVFGSVNYLEWVRNSYTVWGLKDVAVKTSDYEYTRGGAVNADKGIKKIFDSSMLKDYVPKEKDVFVPQADGISEENGMTVISSDDADMKVLDELIPNDGGADEPIRHVIYLEEGSNIYLMEGTYNVYIYGSGDVSIDDDVIIYGGIQAKNIYVGGNKKLEVYHGEPADPSFKTPSSAVGFKNWVPLDYNMNPSLEE